MNNSIARLICKVIGKHNKTSLGGWEKSWYCVRCHTTLNFDGEEIKVESKSR